MALKKSGFSSSRLYRKPEERDFSENQMFTFNTELEDYRVQKTLDDGKKVSYIDTQKWLVANKALTSDGKIIIDGMTYDDGHDCCPILFEELSYKLSKWATWKGRKEFAEKKQVIDLAAIADQMSAT